MTKEKIKNDYSSEEVEVTISENDNFLDSCKSLSDFILSFINDDDIPLELRYSVASTAASICRSKNEKRKD